MSNYIEICGRKIGRDYPPVVIAELGINHEGSLRTAFEMVDSAAAVGVEILKHQTHIVTDEMCGEAKKVIPGNADVSIYEIMDRCSLSEENEIKLKEYVESKGMIFMSTPFSRAAADRLERMGVGAYKIGSGECNNYPLLEHIARFGKPVILSTGMNDIVAIQRAVEIFDRYGVDVALLHTTNLYPTPANLVRLGAMIEMSNAFPDKVFGLSDHTTSNLGCLSAVALGASILERHFTDRMDRTGPDIVCSMDKDTTRSLIEDSKTVWSMRGGKKEATKEEKVTIDFAYATVVTIKSIMAGEKFTMDNIWVKRPGTGEIKAVDFDKIIGREAIVNIDNDIQLKWRMIK